MSTGPDHYRESEALLRVANRAHNDQAPDDAMFAVAKAQVEATQALTAAVAALMMRGYRMLSDVPPVVIDWAEVLDGKDGAS